MMCFEVIEYQRKEEIRYRALVSASVGDSVAAKAVQGRVPSGACLKQVKGIHREAGSQKMRSERLLARSSGPSFLSL
jgi:hypothetical protein